MESHPWQNYFFFAVSIPSFPLYLAVLGIILIKRIHHGRYQSTFYSLIISLGMADLFSVLTACFTNILRTFNLWTDFYWTNRAWMAPLSYNAANFAIMIRLFGAMLIALQRYFIVCWGQRPWSKKLFHLPFFLVFVIHWIPPLLYSLPITLNFNKTFMGPEDMRLVISPEQQQLGAVTQNAFVLATFIASCFAYERISELILKSRRDLFKDATKREIRLSIVALGQGISFAILFTYFAIQYTLSELRSPLVNNMRPYMTIITAFISYWNPWLYIFLNGDIRHEFMKLLKISRGGEISSVQTGQNQGQRRSTQQTTR